MNNADWIKVFIELVGLLAGAVSIVMTLKVSIARLGIKVEANMDSINELKEEMKNITQILAVQAAHEQRFLHIEERLRDLARGDGFVLPLTRRGPHER